ncbi:MAG: LysR family transcriptional regulator [Xanthobacteraceae bacterium]|jgi:DNA-binding transcriptional LysR family regulator
MISASPRRLNVFKSVVDCGGFNIAANQLGIAQPSVGAHIKALESQLGQSLFQRSRGSRPRLTKAGEALYAFAVDALQRSEATTKKLADMRAAVTQEIVLAVQRDIAAHFLPERLTAFTANHPKVHVITRVGTADEVVSLVRTRAAMIGLFLALKPVSGVRCEVLGHERLVLVAAPQHPLADKRPVTTGELQRARFVTGLRNSRFNRMTDAALKAIDVGCYEVAMEVQEATATKEIVRRGNAIACLPVCTVAVELNEGSLASLRLASPLPQLNLYCAYTMPLSENVRDVMKYLRSKTSQRA